MHPRGIRLAVALFKRGIDARCDNRNADTAIHVFAQGRADLDLRLAIDVQRSPIARYRAFFAADQKLDADGSKAERSLLTVLSALGLLLSAFAPSLTWLLIGTALTGLFSVSAQVLVPMAALLAFGLLLHLSVFLWRKVTGRELDNE